MKNSLPIGVFDSGVGGLTVYKQIKQILPNENIVYFGDTARTPYGSRPENQIRQFVDQILTFMQKQHIKIGVAACNTITVLGLKNLQKDYPFSMIGVSQGAELALSKTRNKRIGILATKNTIDSQKHLQKIQELDPGAKVFPIACPAFCPLVENGHLADAEVKAAALEYLVPLKKAEVDTIILACTHYPFLMNTIQKILPNTTIIDPAEETVMQLKKSLTEADLINTQPNSFRRLYFSKDPTKAKELAASIVQLTNEEFKTVCIDK